MPHVFGNMLAFGAKFGVVVTLLVALATATTERTSLEVRPASAISAQTLPRAAHDLTLLGDGRYVVLQFPKLLAVGEAGDAQPPIAVRHPGGMPEALAGPTPDGRVLIGFEDGVLRSWSPGGPGPRWRTVGRHVGPAEMLAVSPDGGLAAAAHVAPEPAEATSSTVTVWDLATGTITARIAAMSPIDGVGFCSGSDRLVTRTGDGTLSVWRARGGENLATVGGGPAGRGSFACSPAGAFVATCVAAGDDLRRVLVCVSDLSDGNRQWETTVDLGSDAAAFHRPRLVFSGDGGLLACGTADAVTIFEACDGRVLAEADAGWHRVSALRFAADGRSVVSAGQDGTVRWWGLPGLCEIRRCEDLLPE